ncbi:putative NAC domain-containing protein 89-like [Capsicum annuum]|nr:putative NAC domain-containing protein 89-like [Capsicum annuum]KAF3644517.1 putative NAC domain-containing protein 89-like [Capsicum annuum]
MTDAAAAAAVPTVTVTGGDDGIPPDPLLQSGTYIDAEENSRVETNTPNKGTGGDVPDEGKEADLTNPAPAEAETAEAETAEEGSKMAAQPNESAAETVTPVRKPGRSVEVNVERPSWLPDDWRFETKVRTNGATAGTVDRYYYEPVSGTKFRSKTEVLYFLETGGKRKKPTGADATPSETPSSKKQKKSSSKKEKKKTTSFYFDSTNPPQSVCWVQTDSSADTWAPFVHGNMVPEGRRQEWDAVFTSVSKLRRKNANRDAGVSNVQ